MTHDDFNKVTSNRFAKCWDTLIAKSTEYATDSDRLYNFKQAAAMQNITPEAALIGMLSKHLVSIFDLVNGIAHDHHKPVEAGDEKIGDAVNYLILLEGLIVERYKGGDARDDESDDESFN